MTSVKLYGRVLSFPSPLAPTTAKHHIFGAFMRVSPLSHRSHALLSNCAFWMNDPSHIALFSILCLFPATYYLCIRPFISNCPRSHRLPLFALRFFFFPLVILSQGRLYPLADCPPCHPDFKLLLRHRIVTMHLWILRILLSVTVCHSLPAFHCLWYFQPTFCWCGFFIILPTVSPSFTRSSSASYCFIQVLNVAGFHEVLSPLFALYSFRDRSFAFPFLVRFLPITHITDFDGFPLYIFLTRLTILHSSGPIFLSLVLMLVVFTATGISLWSPISIFLCLSYSLDYIRCLYCQLARLQLSFRLWSRLWYPTPDPLLFASFYFVDSIQNPSVSH